jgi:hypothetical protein
MLELSHDRQEPSGELVGQADVLEKPCLLV